MDKYLNQSNKTAIERLNENMTNKLYFRLNQFEIINDASINENYLGKNRRYSYYSNCTFENCNFKEAGFSGSIFISCTFNDCNFDFANFQSCQFKNCVFHFLEREIITATRFMKSLFYECNFNSIIMKNINFCDCIFEKGTIENVHFHSCALEDATLKKILLHNVQFSSQNFDYLKIEDIRTKNVVFPFPAMPCIINGFSYVINTSDNVMFTSEKYNCLNRTEYIKYIPDFIEFYKETKNYFFLANLLLSLNKVEEAYSSINLGIQQSMRTHNFKMIKHFITLLHMKCFNIQHKKITYRIIINELNKIELMDSDLENINLYISGIKNSLFNMSDSPYLILNLQTNIDSNNYEDILYFYSFIESIIKEYIGEEETHLIEIRHNSNTNFCVTLFSNPIKLLTFLSAACTCCSFAYKAVKLINKKIKDFVKNKKVKKELKQIEMDNNQSNPSDSNNTLQTNDDHIEDNVKRLIDCSPPVIVIKNTIQITEANHCIFNVNELENNLQNGTYNQ